jgi:hypothetical protein
MGFHTIGGGLAEGEAEGGEEGGLFSVMPVIDGVRGEPAEDARPPEHAVPKSSTIRVSESRLPDFRLVDARMDPARA